MNRGTLERQSKARHRPSHVELPLQIDSSPPPRRRATRRASVSFERRLLQRLLVSLGSPPLTVQLWDGQEVTAHDSGANARMIVHDRGALYRLLLDPAFHFGEGYSGGRIDVEGNFGEFLRGIQQASAPSRLKKSRSRGIVRLLNRARRNTLSGSRKNIHHHYDIGNDFYRLWLDDQLAYTCAYFSRPGQSLEEAQYNKFEHVCRKLWLRPGDTVIEAGCGWGGLALHMAKHYGVNVKAYNISNEQVNYARQRAEKEELSDRVEFVLDDWRNIRSECDVFVSVGMLEHVGATNYRQLGEVIHRSLRRGGRSLIHTIGQNFSRPFDRWTERRIFPGAYPPTLRQMMDIFETNNLSVLDVENIRQHYAETLWHWWDRFERSVDTVRDMFDERFVRMWRLYLAGSMVAFEVGNLQLFQVVAAPNFENAVPRTREHQYTDVDVRFGHPLDCQSLGQGRSAGDHRWNGTTS